MLCDKIKPCKDRVFPHLLIRLVLCFSEEADVLDESGFDMFVIHKLTEDVKLLTQELVGEIHLMKAERRKNFSKQVQIEAHNKNPKHAAAIPVNSLWCS